MWDGTILAVDKGLPTEGKRIKEDRVPKSSPEENKTLVRRFSEEVYTWGNLDVAEELLAPDYVSRDEITGKKP